MRRVALLVAGSAAAALALTACGSDSSSPASSGSSAPVDTASGASSTATTTEPTVAGSSPSTLASTSASTSAAASVGPAPAGSAIKAGASTALPTTVGDYAKQAGSGPATIYSADGKLISITFLSGSNYDSIVTAIKAQQTPAGTGRCGVTTSASNVTCYLKAADGVYNLSADAGDAPVAAAAVFANQFTAAVGTG